MNFKRNLRNEYEKKKRGSRKLFFSALMSAMIMFIVSAPSFAATTGSSLLVDYPEVGTTITGFAGQIIPTVLEIVGIVVGVGLTLWAIGFAIKKGLAVMQKNAKKAL